MTVPDEEVFAFVDGELPPEAMARIEAAMVSDPQLALRVETQRALRRLLSGAHAGVVREPPPEAMSATVAAKPPPTSKPAEVIAFPGAKAKAKAKEKARPREPKPPRPAAGTGGGLPAWVGLAACLAVGLLVGRQAAPPPVTLSGADDPAPIAAGPLARALNVQASSPPPLDRNATGPVRITLSFRTASGIYCRAFQARGRSPLAGVACREADAWRVRAVSPAVGGPEMPVAVGAVVDAMIAGPPLDAAGEAKARATGWKPVPGARKMGAAPR
jgi:anti-sigma factor RsiW